MKKYIGISLCILVITLGACKDGFKNKFAADNKFVSEEGKFKVSFPNTPKASSEVIPYTTGNFTIPIHMFLDEETPIKTAVIYADYPKGILKGTDNNAQKVLSGAKEGALGSLANNMGSYVVQSQKDIVVNEHPGIVFNAKFENGLCVIYELVLVNDRLYQVRMFTEKDYPKKEISDKFFNSFEITE